jgi:hypothetical protein
MNRSAIARLRRIERRDGSVEFWLDCGDGFVRSGRTGVAVPAEQYRAAYPRSFHFTFHIDAVDLEAAP